MRIGEFEPNESGLIWVRQVPEEGTTITMRRGPDEVILSISPSVITYDHHLNKRITASIYFEIAAKYAEKVGGEIRQLGRIYTCWSNLPQVMASYPSQPLKDWSTICHGFREAITGE